MTARATRLPVVPATHSILDAGALSAVVAARYPVSGDVEARLVRRGLNDVYELRAAGNRYMLRVCRTGWRADEDVAWEGELLDHLAAAGVPVTVFEPTTDGQPFVAAQAPEGRRQLVLLSFADGSLVREGKPKGTKPSVTEFPEQYGELCAKVHAGADSFTTRHSRFALDAEHLLWQPLRAIEPFLADRHADRDWLVDVVRSLAEQIDATAATVDSGPCHGDVTGGNAVLRDGALTLFDFDSGGPGPRAYDLGVFAWSMRLQQAPPDTGNRFLAGYQRVRPLSDATRTAIPLFAAVREIWFMGLQAGNAPDWGYGLADDDFFDARLRFLDSLCEDVR